MRRFVPFLAAAALLAAPIAPADAQQGSGPGSIQGTFVLDRAASDDVGKAIDAAVRPLNFVTRPIARGRLSKTNRPYERVTIATSGAETQVTVNGGASRAAPSSGQPIPWTREDGERLELSMAWERGRLVESFKAEDGQRVNAYSLSPDGSTLTLDVTVRSPRLPKPLTYRLAFRRS